MGRMHLAICTDLPPIESVSACLEAWEKAGHVATIISSVDEVSYPDLIDVFWMRFPPNAHFGNAPPRFYQAAQLLEARGVPALNPILSQDVSANKLVANRLFEEMSLTPPPFFSLERAEEAFEGRESMVCKPLYGSRGYGVKRVFSAEEAREHEEALDKPCLLQEIVKFARCIRVVASEEEVIATYEKKTPTREEFSVASIFQGEERVEVEDKTAGILAKEMLRSVGGDIGGMDILIDEEGNHWPLEVNLSFGFDPEDTRITKAFVKAVEIMGGYKGFAA
jgi:glutathione synthase/RimK-type ligase-like ATP-grasp enzyme